DFTFSPDATTIYNPEIQFVDQSFDAWEWFWNFGDGYFSNEANPAHSYEAPGTFMVELTVQNEYNCVSQDVATVTIGEEFNMYVPNSFTPDGDNINDYFLPVILGPELLDFYELRITDRWGVLLFESNDTKEPWLADFNQGGEYYVISDVYIWQVKMRLKGAERSELVTGHVTVIR
ncbi:MAG: PKD domain-containing protein, partial [Flavobacteriales bacterium]|nr:PKD domain-containing protein [Flavobacteriales bacterium]